MINLRQLINIAPFPEETKEELLSKENSLSDSQKFELEEKCWILISQWYHNELRARQEKATMEMAQGINTYEKEDFSKMAENLFEELIKKFNDEATEEDIENVREKLAKIS